MKKTDEKLANIPYAEAVKLASALRADATSLVARYVESGTQAVQAIVGGGLTEMERASHAVLAEQLFNDAEEVAVAFGVEFYIPWDYEYEETLSSQLENVDKVDGDESLADLIDVLQDMEYTCAGWNRSTC